ncbi:DNA alkylation repair protein [Pleionea sp. CnH1-48]|uniref:DNA alkylation repair protein n=1 Tax=Pleionea sp. CnH1-48 TaxID=2954494 RepID=UPI0020980DCC|nr:DNA alkylation repair protein [Pleionea sp. CnH1-48]MCO7225992.1 DNA alkylation repair protein [Pleionea sp. CnH1-48]
MNKYKKYTNELKSALKQVSTEEKAESSRRYFPNGIHCIGVNATDIKTIIADFHKSHSELSPEEVLAITEATLKQAEYHEEVMVAFGLVTKYVKKHYDDSLLERFEFWLEHYASNWAQTDDLCMKTIYQFMLSRPHLIEQVQRWGHSKVSWCRRGNCVVWVKFINRKIGKTVYVLDKKLIFKQCDLLLEDEDEFVQKGVGWLLKVTAAHHESDVIKYIKKNASKMTRGTLRYAIEKMDKEIRKGLLALS